MVIIVFGLPGSGKSYFASRLAEKMAADYINSDRLRKEMYENCTYSEEEKKAVYNEMITRMKAALHQNRHVVLDATFHKNNIRKQFIDEMSDKGGINFIEVWADEDVIKERLKKPRDYSDADFTIYQLLRTNNEPMNDPHLKLQSTNSDNINSNLQKAFDYLRWKDDKRTSE